MEPLISLGINIIILISTFLLFFRYGNRKISIKYILFIIILLFAPLFNYQAEQLIFSFLPFLTLIFLFLVIFYNKNQLILIISLLYIYFASILISNIIVWPFHFQIDYTILANNHIPNAIFEHQHDALYLPFKLRPILFNSLVYFYFIFTQIFTFLSFSNLYNIVLLANLYPLILGLISLLKYPSSTKKLFILGGIIITLLVIGFSRSISEISVLFIISPLFIYLILVGLEKVNTKIYLVLLFISLAFQLNAHL